MLEGTLVRPSRLKVVSASLMCLVLLGMTVCIPVQLVLLTSLPIALLICLPIIMTTLSTWLPPLNVLTS